jgi:hypothetical protein
MLSTLVILSKNEFVGGDKLAGRTQTNQARWA